MSANQASLLFCSFALLAVIVMLFTQRAYRRELRTLRAMCLQHDKTLGAAHALIAQHEIVNAAREKQVLYYRWREWWQRNAAQTPPCDRGRYYLCQLAYASVLAPSTEVFLRACERLRDDERLPAFARLAAGAFPGEMQARLLPWDQWEEDNPGTPPHTQGQLQAMYERVLHEVEAHGLAHARILLAEESSAQAQHGEIATAKPS
jgi:hypothetical protein